MAAVELSHQFVVEIVRHLLALPRPNHEFGGVREVAARDVGRRVAFDPCNDIQDFESQCVEGVGDGKDVVVGAANPNRAAVLEFLPAQRQPFQIEVVDAGKSSAFVPRAFVVTDDFPGMGADSAIGEKTGWVCKDCATA